MARGTTLLARPEGPCISRRMLARAPLTRTYLGKSPFFGRPLGGAFDSVPSVPGFHHPRVAWMNELSTTPRQHGHRQDESRRKDNSRNLRVVYEMLATPSGSVNAPAAAAESGEDPPRGVLCSSRCPPEAAFHAISAPERGNKKVRGIQSAPTTISYTTRLPLCATRAGASSSLSSYVRCVRPSHEESARLAATRSDAANDRRNRS